MTVQIQIFQKKILKKHAKNTLLIIFMKSFRKYMIKQKKDNYKIIKYLSLKIIYKKKILSKN